ncbi:hypothetical protein AVEN_106104-1 [Araneus ventricosus]|uniref:Uncharacterized protein n=1 Tax=Araneus ventricosus TaxID=182803 RepID=A0A4Y2HTS9_ARAVE|nr:hypothetical protein AVEN_106104-1 [Araneus ventricosus]
MNKSSPLTSVNIWVGILGDYAVGPYILPDHLTGTTYRIFFEQVLPSLLQVVPLPIQRNMWFMRVELQHTFPLLECYISRTMDSDVADLCHRTSAP